MAGISDSINPGQFFMTEIIRFADTKQILARPDDMINTLGSFGRRTGRLRRATGEETGAHDRGMKNGGTDLDRVWEQRNEVSPLDFAGFWFVINAKAETPFTPANRISPRA